MRRKLMWVCLVVLLAINGGTVMAQDPDDIYWDTTIATADGGLNGAVWALAVYEGKLIVAGEFTTAGGIAVNHIAAWDGSTWSALGTGLSEPVGVIANFNNHLIVAGGFDTAGGIAAQRVAAWDGNTWTSLGSGLDTTFWAWTMAEFDGRLIVGGAEDSSAGHVDGLRIWDGQTWAPMAAPGWDSPVSQLAVYHGMLVATSFCYPGNSSPIAAWNGNAWVNTGLPPGIPVGFICDVLVCNDELIVGGGGGCPVISWDGTDSTSWSCMQDGGYAPSAMAIHGSRLYQAWGTVLGGGEQPPPFGYYGQVEVWVNSVWVSLGSGYAGGGGLAMMSYEGDLVLGGNFAQVGGKYSPYIAIWTKQDPTDVQGEQDSQLPDRFLLYQNYPNPFNPVTTIEYSVPTRSHVTIGIFNLLGQHVRTLVDEMKSAGTHKTEWNGNDDGGRPASTGVYLYRFQSGDVVQAKKMLLLK